MRTVFKRCGMLNAIDGSEDDQINVADLEDNDINVGADDSGDETTTEKIQSDDEKNDSDMTDSASV